MPSKSPARPATAQPANLRATLVPIDSLKPHPRNYNRHPDDQVDELVKSVQQFKQLKNIVTWRGKIIAGEGLWRAMKKAGHKRISVIDASHLSAAEALAFMATDNEIQRLSQPDMAALASIIEEARSAEVETPGISDERFKAILAAATPADPEFKEYNEGAANEVRYHTCPQCGHKFA